MKRRIARPVILTFPTFEVKPRILPFRVPTMNPSPVTATATATPPAAGVASRSELEAVRDRLFRMIVANEWDRSHGNRAS
jgi:hypothetical protein